MTTTTLTADQIARATEIAEAADANGTIQPEAALRIFRRDDPRWHEAQTIETAWSRALPGIDAGDITEALWG